MVERGQFCYPNTQVHDCSLLYGLVANINLGHRCWLSCSCRLVYLLFKTFELFGISICRLWAYLMKVFPEGPRVHIIEYLRSLLFLLNCFFFFIQCTCIYIMKYSYSKYQLIMLKPITYLKYWISNTITVVKPTIVTTSI